MPRRVDGRHLLEAEVPEQVRVGERCDEGAAGAVDVQRDVPALLGLDPDQQVVDLLDRVRLADVGGAEHRPDGDRVLVQQRLDVGGVDRVAIRLHRDLAHLDVEVVRELVPHDVGLGAEDHVGAAGVLARGLTAVAPRALVGQQPEHDRLGGADRADADHLCRVRRVEEVAEHVDARLLDERRRRVLLVVDVVLAERLVDEQLRLGIHPGRHERREVQPLAPVEHQRGVQQLVGLAWVHAVIGEVMRVDVVAEPAPTVDGAVAATARSDRSRSAPVVVGGWSGMRWTRSGCQDLRLLLRELVLGEDSLGA